MIGAAITGLIWLVLHSNSQVQTYRYCEEYVQIKEIPSMMDFYFYSDKEWEEKIAAEDFGEVLNGKALKWILEETGTGAHITCDVKDKEILTRMQWNEAYEQLLDLLDEEHKIQLADEVILKKEEDTLVCSSGKYTFDIKNIEIHPMMAMSFYIKEDKIIGIRQMKSTSAGIDNVYVQSAEKSKLDFLMNGEQYTLELTMENPQKVANRVCDLIWEDGMVARVQVKEDTIQGNLIAVNESTIEIDGYGEINRSDNLPVYKTYGTIEQKKISDIVIANMKVEYVVAKDSVEAILLTEPAQINKIRVLLLGEDNCTYREDVYIGSNSAYQITRKQQNIEQTANTIVKASELFATGKGKSIHIKPCDENGELFICDAKGNPISKGYLGSMEIRKYKEGYTLVNELPIEQYLCAVVPSEMPASYELEALKAQAICARSYAYIQLERGDYAAFGAHVDDSTNYQVYNKQDKNEKTTAAVLDTAGMILSYSGATAEAYYFSTSAGVTGNGEAWNLTADPQYGYLRNGLVKEGGGEIDLSTEDAFQKFIKEPDAAAYESALPYFRWKATGDYSSEEIQKKIQTVINTRKARTPEDILIQNKKQRSKKKMKNMGKLLRLCITRRSSSGVILQLQLEYEKGIVSVENEYNIRAILGTGLMELTLADGSKKETTLLPSAYTTLIPLENGTYSMTGGGYGHGIGMSQNGAAAMAAQGKSCEEILKFFFQNIEICNCTG